MNCDVQLQLQDFSQALFDLFHAAETTSPDDFPAALLDVLKRHLVFDGAVVGHAEPLCYGDFSIAVAHVHQREPSLLDEYRLVSAGDPVTKAFLGGLAQPLAVDTEQLYSAGQHAALLVYTRKHRLRHLLLCGYPPSLHQRGRWIVLYRSADHGFDAMTIDWFGAFCTQMDRALDLNRAKALGHLVPPSRRKGVALVDKEGRIDRADALFPVLLQSEFRNALPHRLPDGLLLAMKQGRPFEGRLIQAHFSPVGSHQICELREAGPLSRLSPREGEVARRFAQGCTNREIAAEMGVSISTVHSQLASVYRKLGVSDKATFSRVLAESGN